MRRMMEVDVWVQQSKLNKRKEYENDIRCHVNQSIFHSNNYHQFAHQLQLKEEQENSCDVACVFI